MELNAHGVYELPEVPGMPPTLRLLISDTAMNNQTEIFCNRGALSTILFVYGGSTLMFKRMYPCLGPVVIHSFPHSFT